MGVIIRQSIKGTIVSYAGSVIGYLNVLILFPLFFSTEEIGLYRVLIDGAIFFAIFSVLGTPDTMIKFFPYFSNQDKKHNGFLTYATLIPILGFSLFATAFFLFEDSILQKFIKNSPLLVEYGFYLFPLAFLILFYNIFTVYARSLLRIVIPKLIREFLIRVLLAGGTVLYYLEVLDFQEFIMWVVGSYAFALVLLIGYVYNLGHLFLKPRFTVFRSSKFKEMSTFSLVTLLGSGSGVIVAKIDTLMLGSMDGLDQAGIYAVAFSLGAVIQLPRRSLADIASPLIASAFKSNNLPKIKEIYQKTSLNLLLIGAFLFTGIWTNIDSIFQLIPNSERFISGKDVVLFIGLAKMLDMAFGVNNEIITNSPYYRWNLLFVPMLAIMTVAFNLLLIPEYGILGAAMASFISMASINILRLIFVVVKLGLHPITPNTVKALFIAAVAYYVAIMLPIMDNIYLDIGLKGSVIVLIYLVLVLALKPSKELHKLLQMVKGKAMRK